MEKYFVSYKYKTEKQEGYGNAIIKIKNKIECLDSIREIEKYIREDIGEIGGELMPVRIVCYKSIPRTIIEIIKDFFKDGE